MRRWAGRPNSRFDSSSPTPTPAARCASAVSDASSRSNASTTRAIRCDAPTFIARYARIAAPIVDQSGRLFVNHGGAGDELYEKGYKLMVGVLSPASDYLRGFVRLLTQLKLWRKRVAIVASKSAFARSV